MIELKNIKKNFKFSEQKVKALRGISLKISKPGKPLDSAFRIRVKSRHGLPEKAHENALSDLTQRYTSTIHPAHKL